MKKNPLWLELLRYEAEENYMFLPISQAQFDHHKKFLEGLVKKGVLSSRCCKEKLGKFSDCICSDEFIEGMHRYTGLVMKKKMRYI